MSYPKKVTCPYCMESFDNPIIKGWIRNAAVLTDACPHCKRRIPKDYLCGKVSTKYVFFIGSPSVGKTRLIGNLVIESERKFGRIDILPEWTVAPDPDPRKDVTENGARDFYVQYAMDIDGASVGSTTDSMIDMFPMVLYKLGQVGRGRGFLRSLVRPFSQMETTYVAFVDASGDWFTFKKLPANSQDPFPGKPSRVREEYRRRFAKADAVVLVMEPGHIPGMFAADDKDENGNCVMRRVDTGIETILSHLKLLLGNKLKKMPVAFTLSKFDTLFKSHNAKANEFLTIFNNGSGNSWESGTNLDCDDIEKMRSNGRALQNAILDALPEGRERENVRMGLSAFPRSCLFGISSTGMGGLRNERKCLCPLHVLDPLLWMFYEWGCLGRNLFVK